MLCGISSAPVLIFLFPLGAGDCIVVPLLADCMISGDVAECVLAGLEEGFVLIVETADRRSATDFVLVGALFHLLDIQPPTDPIRPLFDSCRAGERPSGVLMPLSACMLGLCDCSKPDRDVAVYSVTVARG